MSRLGYSNEDFLNLIIIYGECNRNISRACDVFAERYPDILRPNRNLVRRTLENCATYGSFKAKSTKIKPMVNNEDLEITILGYFTAYPAASLRQAQRDLRISFKTIHRVLCKHKWKPFSYNVVQNLWPGDLPRRIAFCEFLIIKLQEDPTFTNKIIWSDEAKFSKNGMFNRHNSHFWAEENPHVVRDRQFQNVWSFNIYCAVKNDSILCIHMYDENLNGAIYINILQTTLAEAIENLPLAESVQLWYQHDGAPAHSGNAANVVLTQMFEDKWFAKNGPQLWPPRSPDLTPMDFFIWGYIKNIVYADPVTTKENMQERVRNAFRDLPREQIHRATSEGLTRRLNLCLDNNGSTFEHSM